MEQTIKKLKRIGHSALAIMIMLMLVITSLPGGLFSTAENADAIELAGISGSLESKKLLQYDMKSAKYMQLFWADYKEKILSEFLRFNT